MKPSGIVLYADDLEEAINFYTTLLGEEPSLIERKRGFAEFDLEGFHLIVHETPVSTAEKPVTGRPTPVLEILADPEASHQRLSASKFPTPAVPTDRNYGLRQMNVEDPGGNRLAIVRPIETI